MIIEDCFKEFHSYILQDPLNKKKENLNITKEIHAKAQLVDISNLSFSNVKDKLTIKNICLPFEITFLKLSESVCNIDDIQGHFQICVFIREYSNALYSGTLALLENSFMFNIPFCLFYAEDGWNINLQNNQQYSKQQNLFHKKLIMEALYRLEKISNKKHDLYVTKDCKTMTFRNRALKQKFKVNKPVYIYTEKSKDIKYISEYKNRKLEKQISWNVRGHWRKIDSKKRGKNPQGEYIVEGFTWVKPHVCGNSDVKKVYIVND